MVADGNYTNTVVRDNIILGGFANKKPASPTETKGENDDDAIIKSVGGTSVLYFHLLNLPLYLFHRIGIAIGPRTWFGDRYLKNVSFSGTVLSNHLSGAFGYAVAITSARNFTIENNVLFGNTTFIGSRGPNCSTTDTTPTPQPFVFDKNNTEGLTLQSTFTEISDGDSLTCILPPDGGDYWPFGGGGSSNNTTPGGGGGGSTPGNSGSSGLSRGAKAGIAIGVILGVVLIAVATYFIRKAALRQQQGEGSRRLGSEDVDTWEGKQTTAPPS